MAKIKKQLPPDRVNPMPARDRPRRTSRTSRTAEPSVTPSRQSMTAASNDVPLAYGGSADVIDQIDRVIDKGGPLMTRAETAGKAYGASRGLQNSTMAAQAGQEAVLGYALPIAQQNASQGFQSRLSRQDYGQQRGLASQNYDFNRSLSRQGFEQSRTLQSDQAAQQRDLNEQNYGFQTNLQTLQGEQQRQLQANELETRTNIALMDANLQLEIQNNNLGSQERATAGQLALEADRIYANTLANINANPDMSATQRSQFLNNASTVREKSINMIENLYSTDLNWMTPAQSAAPATAPVPTNNAIAPPTISQTAIRGLGGSAIGRTGISR